MIDSRFKGDINRLCLSLNPYFPKLSAVTDTSDHKSSRIGRVLKTPVVSMSSDQIVIHDQKQAYTIHKDSD